MAEQWFDDEVHDWELRACRNDDPVHGLGAIPDKSVDVTITDPPYEAEAHTMQRRQKGRHTVVGREEYRQVNAAPLTFAPITSEQRSEVAHQIARVTRHAAIVFCQIEAVGDWRLALEAGGMRYRRTIPWIKPDAMPSLHGRWPGQSFEAIVLATHRGARPCPVGGKAVSYTFVREKLGVGGLQKMPHPTTKPQPLMRALVADFSVEGDLVIDPFAGSGSTGVACRMLGRRFIGWESDVNMAEIARRRIAGDRAVPVEQQMEMF